MILFDAEGRIATWNVGAERMFGYTEQQALGKSGMLFYPDGARENQWTDELSAARHTGRATQAGLHQRRNGEKFTAVGVLSPIQNDAGAITGLVKIIRDESDDRSEHPGG